jgi:hypothetical protein
MEKENEKEREMEKVKKIQAMMGLLQMALV